MRAPAFTMFCAAACACSSPERAPLSAGEHVRLSQPTGGAAPVIDVDSAVVPILDAESSCTTGQVVEQTGGRWTCAELRRLELSRIDVLERDVRFLRGEVGRLTRARDDLRAALANAEGKLAELSSAPQFAVAAQGGCRTLETAVRTAHSTGGGIEYLAPTTRDIAVVCPVYATAPRVDWNTVEVFYDDPDGEDGGAVVEAVMRGLSRADGTIYTLPSLPTTISTRMPGLVVASTRIMNHTLDFEASYYFVQVAIERTTTALRPRFLELRVLHR